MGAAYQFAGASDEPGTTAVSAATSRGRSQPLVAAVSIMPEKKARKISKAAIRSFFMVVGRFALVEVRGRFGRGSPLCAAKEQAADQCVMI